MPMLPHSRGFIAWMCPAQVGHTKVFMKQRAYEAIIGLKRSAEACIVVRSPGNAFGPAVAFQLKIIKQKYIWIVVLLGRMKVPDDCVPAGLA